MVVASSFPEQQQKISIAARVSVHPSLRTLGMDGTTHCSSFARASEITLRCLYLRVETLKNPFSSEVLATWSLLRPGLPSVLFLQA